MNCNEDKRSDNNNFNSSEHTVAVMSDSRNDDSALTQCEGALTLTQCEEDSLKDDDYYETISADGSICGDDSFTNIESEKSHLNNNEQCSFLDLPFVPKLEQVAEEISPFVPVLNNSDTNTQIHTNNSKTLATLGLIKPNFDFSIPPPNYEVLEQKCNTSGSHTDDQLFTSSNHDSRPTSSLVSTGNNLSNNSNITKAKESFNPSILKTPIADWLDENGDPIKGAFDNIEVNNSAGNNASKSSKVEYVFSVKETKSVQVSNSYFLHPPKLSDVDNLNNTNLGLPTEKLKVYEEEKNLYLASKSGDEYKVALQSNATSLSNPGTNKTIAENAKKELLNRFRRTPIADKQSEPTPDVPQTEEPKKTQEEVALESQAVTEILKEIQRGAARAKEHGALGWQKCPVPVTNKTFLRNTLVSTLREPYRPPAKRGRFHVGLHGDKNQSRYYDDNSDSSSSDSQSSRSSRSPLSSRSSSGSSHIGDEDYNERNGRGSWSHDQFYDEWAAYYGYQWYGPEAYNMYYGSEGWPADPYMYYENTQGWHDYNSYYGSQNVNYPAQGRGMNYPAQGRGMNYPAQGRGMNYPAQGRGMNYPAQGRGMRGRGWGNPIKDLREYIPLPKSRSKSYSRSSSRSRSETSRIRCETSRNRSETSHSKSEKSHRQETGRSKSRSVSRSKTNHKEASTSDSKRHRVQSHSPTNVKKKKTSSKKKKKHKKKSKHKKSKVDRAEELSEEELREDCVEEAEMTLFLKDKDGKKNEGSKLELNKEKGKSKKSFDKQQDSKETHSGQKVRKLISRNSQDKRQENSKKRKKTDECPNIDKVEKLKDDNEVNVKKKDHKDSIDLEKKETKVSNSSCEKKTKSVCSDQVNSKNKHAVKVQHHHEAYGKKMSSIGDLKSGNVWSKSSKMDDDLSETSKRMKGYYHSDQKDSRRLKYQTSNMDDWNLQVASTASNKNSLQEKDEHSKNRKNVLNISQNTSSKSKIRRKPTEMEDKDGTEQHEREVQARKQERNDLTSAANFQKRKSTEEMKQSDSKIFKVVQQGVKLSEDKNKKTCHKTVSVDINLCNRDSNEKSFDQVSKKIELSKNIPASVISVSKKERSKNHFEKSHDLQLSQSSNEKRKMSKYHYSESNLDLSACIDKKADNSQFHNSVDSVQPENFNKQQESNFKSLKRKNNLLEESLDGAKRRQKSYSNTSKK